MTPKAVPSYADEFISAEPARRIHKELYRDAGYDAIRSDLANGVEYWRPASREGQSLKPDMARQWISRPFP